MVIVLILKVFICVYVIKVIFGFWIISIVKILMNVSKGIYV